jgi:hypothetical protein
MASLRKVIEFSLLGAVCATLLATTRACATDAPTEYEVKAAFLCKFANFTAWPPTAFPAANTPFCIGILGTDPFGDILEQGCKTIDNRPVAIKRFKRVADVTPCHLLFISQSENQKLAKILPAVSATGVLTVGEAEEFCRLGGIINFMVEQKKVRFEISAESAREVGLTIHPQVLSLAKICRAQQRTDAK